MAPKPNVRLVHGYIKMEPWGLSPSGPEANSKQECQDSSEESGEPSHHGTAGHPGLGIGHSHTESIPPPPDARGSEPGRPQSPPPGHLGGPRARPPGGSTAAAPRHPCRPRRRRRSGAAGDRRQRGQGWGEAGRLPGDEAGRPLPQPGPRGISGGCF